MSPCHDAHIERPATTTKGTLACHDNHRRQATRTVGHDRMVRVEFTTGIHPDRTHATHDLLGQCKSQPRSSPQDANSSRVGTDSRLRPGQRPYYSHGVGAHFEASASRLKWVLVMNG
jgi:hypothetical protein